MSEEADGVAEAIAGELKLMSPHVRASRELAGQLLDPDFVAVGPSGGRWDRQAMLSELPDKPGASDDGPLYEPFGMAGTVLAPGVVHVTYEAVLGERRSLHSSIWRKLDEDSGWRMYHHQGILVLADQRQ
jgi:hypothetical protein